MAAPSWVEKISRDANSLGGLITQNLAEFDRTVKV